ncbi:MAG: hypothetical protein PW734_00565 [Verrucomicrobium sp.]|nr:hypothetical protein [Verrucomicrobium sp.]
MKNKNTNRKAARLLSLMILGGALVSPLSAQAAGGAGKGWLEVRNDAYEAPGFQYSVYRPDGTVAASRVQADQKVTLAPGSYRVATQQASVKAQVSRGRTTEVVLKAASSAPELNMLTGEPIR